MIIKIQNDVELEVAKKLISDMQELFLKPAEKNISALAVVKARQIELEIIKEVQKEINEYLERKKFLVHFEPI
jgi:isochorismate hydrolase